MIWWESVRAATMAALPVGVFTYLVVILAGKWAEDADEQTPNETSKSSSESSSEIPHVQRLGNMLHNNWVEFGGGFYGLMALLTWAIQEVKQIYEIVSGITWFGNWISQAIDIFVTLIVESIMNAIEAFIWPVTWMDTIDSPAIWIWFVAAYAGYYAGLAIARQHLEPRSSETS